MARLRNGRLAAFSIVVWLAGAGGAVAETCANGAEVDNAAKHCFFQQYKKDSHDTDKRILTELGEDGDQKIRSIALVITVDDYPQLNDSLPPVIRDRDNLIKFLDGDQDFDEVILLKNKDVTKANIDYFLQNYLPARALEYKVRLLVAYSGHGVPKGATTESSLLLAGASDMVDPQYLYDLPTLKTRLLKLSELNFHMLVLVNACFGGDIFKIPGISGTNPDVTDKRGSFIVTAGRPDIAVASLGGPNDGSIFFDNLIHGVESGQADLDYNRLVSQSGELYQYGGLVRLGPLNTYMTTEAKIMTNRHIPTHDGPLVVDAPWSGPIASTVEDSGGGFFFLAPIRVVSNDLNAAPIEVPAGPISSIPGHPEIKVFKPQQQYAIRGIDVSQHEDDIIWTRVQKAGYDFAYLRASSSVGRKDTRFDEHWSKTKEIGLLRGAYHGYSYCLPVDDQLRLIEEVVPREDDALPFALDVETPTTDKERGCKAALSKNELSNRLVALSDGVSSYFGKTSLIYGNRSTLQEYFGGASGADYDHRLDRFMVWLAVWKGSNGSDTSSIRLPGRNPWTLWQYTGSATIPGIGDNVDVNVFFGTGQQFEAFRKGSTNVALAAADLK
jgi:GH25 family lysozyme M1 (1,4-beta-N-acetylmuramidase)